MKGFDFMEQAKDVQERLKGVQEEFVNLEVTGESGGGLVVATINGRHEVVKIHIDQDLMVDSKDILEELVAASINSAVRKLEQAQKEKMSSIASGLGLPFGKLPF